MAKFIMMFRGGTVPPEQYEEHGKAWSAWFEELGASGKLVDSGAPLVQGGKSVSAGGEVLDYDWKTDSNVNGFSILEVDNIDDAVALSKGCPALDPAFIDGKVEVRELSAI